VGKRKGGITRERSELKKIDRKAALQQTYLKVGGSKKRVPRPPGEF